MHPDLPDLATAEGREDFARILGNTLGTLRRYYPKVESRPRSNGICFAWDLDSRSAWKIELIPARNPGVFRVWLTMETKRSQRTAVARLDHVISKGSRRFKGATAVPAVGKGRSEHCVSISLPYRSLFPRKSSSAAKGRRLAETISQLVHAAGVRQRGLVEG
jgi:hypothetical protein